MRNLLRYWRDAGYWRWRWQRASDGTRLVPLVLLACLVGVGGYLTAGLAGSAETTASFVPPTHNVVTVQRTVVHRVKGTARVVTEVQRVPVRTSSGQRVVTLAGREQTVVREVTVQRPGRDRFVTRPRTRTVLQSQTVERPITVTTAINGPTRTVTDRITSPGRTVTVAGPTQTVTSTVTQPPRTITETNTVTTTDTVTTTATVSVTVTIPCKKPLC